MTWCEKKNGVVAVALCRRGAVALGLAQEARS